jgi:polysaccharide export outer membrane protein
MKLVNRVKALGIVALFVFMSTGLQAQTPTTVDSQKTRQRTATTTPSSDQSKSTQNQKQKPAQPADRLEPDDKTRVPADVPEETQSNRQEQISEENAVVPYYNNFFNTYRLGPEDIISVNIFGQERYSKSGIVIPPNGRIALALVPEGVFVNGKTVNEVQDIIRKKYDEYIVDPQVSVSLDRASSYRYSILGDVAAPGVRPMARRMTVTEAIAEAGGVTQLGNKSKVTVLRRQPNGQLSPIVVNVSKIYKGEVADTLYLVPGDQILVPGNKFKTFQKIMGLTSVLSFATIFGHW